MNHIQPLSVWVRQWFHSEKWKPCCVGVFGSTARYSLNPRDYDLLIIVKDSFSNEYWKFIQEQRSKLITDARQVFNVPLSPTILTISEFKESNCFIKSIIVKPIVTILGDWTL